jgi:glycosyltransferase involved in cell wall biosynthesis
VWSGVHVGRKALPIVLHALARLGDAAPAELAVLGGGPETGRWKGLADELGLSGRVRWAGHLSQADAVAEVSRADVLAFSSLQEGTPQAVLEALSLGLPVVCHDACGMGVAVTDGCGVKVPMRDPGASVAGFADAIRRLATDGRELGRLSAGALRRSEELTWDANARRIAEGYNQVVEIVEAAGAAAAGPEAAARGRERGNP